MNLAIAISRSKKQIIPLHRYLCALFSFLILSLTTIQAQIWTQIGEDIVGEGGNDGLGSSVSLSSDGNILAIGATEFDLLHPEDDGYVQTYRNISGTWTLIGENIYAEDMNDKFGFSVSLSSDGSIVAIGGPWNDGNGSFAGHVRVYQNISGIWTQIGKDIDGEAAGDKSGSSISLSSDGSVVAVGAPDNDGTGTVSGHVRIYENISGTWTQIGEDIDGETQLDKSGWSVSLSSDGTVVAIGAPYNDNNGTDSGHVRIFENISGIWTQIGEDIDGEDQFNYFGSSVALSSNGSIVAVGAPNNDSNGQDAGHVKVFQNISGTWTKIGESIEGDSVYHCIGRHLSLNSLGNIVLIGSNSHFLPHPGGPPIVTGYARIYKNISENWIQVGEEIKGDLDEDYFGSSVSIDSSGSIVVIGAPQTIWGTLLHCGPGYVRVFSSPFSSIIPKNSTGNYFSIYPNPTTGILNVNFKERNIYYVNISDFTGKTLFEKTVIEQTNTLNISSLKTGIYIIRIQTDNEIFTSRIVKE